MFKKFQKMFFIFLKKYVSENAKNRMFYILEKTEILKNNVGKYFKTGFEYFKNVSRYQYILA